ncbi:MAG TPA: hypothetical protein VMF67_05470 [Rhizomicrobium sp.]|nr:hypothetical protein [Rhizomicrobium sp.]
MGDDAARIERYRNHAEELRMLAEGCQESTKAQVLNMARDYDRMAEALEKGNGTDMKASNLG